MAIKMGYKAYGKVSINSFKTSDLHGIRNMLRPISAVDQYWDGRC